MGLKDLTNFEKRKSSGEFEAQGKKSRTLKKNQKERTPFLIIRHYDEPPQGKDEWEVLRYPKIPQYLYTREDEDADWQLADKYSYDEKIVWSRSGFNLVKDRIEREHGENLNHLLAEDIPEALRLIKRAGGPRNVDAPDMRPKCTLCGERHDDLSGNWARIKHKAVCMSHTVEELHEEGLLDDL